MNSDRDLAMARPNRMWGIANGVAQQALVGNDLVVLYWLRWCAKEVPGEGQEALRQVDSLWVSSRPFHASRILNASWWRWAGHTAREADRADLCDGHLRDAMYRETMRGLHWKAGDPDRQRLGIRGRAHRATL